MQPRTTGRILPYPPRSNEPAAVLATVKGKSLREGLRPPLTAAARSGPTNLGRDEEMSPPVEVHAYGRGVDKSRNERTAADDVLDVRFEIFHQTARHQSPARRTSGCARANRNRHAKESHALAQPRSFSPTAPASWQNCHKAKNVATMSAMAHPICCAAAQFRRKRGTADIAQSIRARCSVASDPNPTLHCSTTCNVQMSWLHRISDGTLP